MNLSFPPHDERSVRGVPGGRVVCDGVPQVEANIRKMIAGDDGPTGNYPGQKSASGKCGTSSPSGWQGGGDKGKRAVAAVSLSRRRL